MIKKNLIMCTAMIITAALLASCGGSKSGAAKNPPTPEELYAAKAPAAPDPAKLADESGTVIIPEMTVIPTDYIKQLPKDKKIVNLIIPEGVTKIEKYAFNGPTLLGKGTITTVVLPSTLTDIGDFAFENQSITELYIPGNVTNIGAQAFGGNKITELYIPDNVTKIGGAAFSDNKITKLTMPKNWEEIPGSCFAKNDLKGVILPTGLVKIGRDAFRANKNLNTVIWPDGPVEFEQRDRAPDETYKPEGLFFAECGFTEATFPKGITAIPEAMYRGNKIKNLVIPEGVEIVGADAFFDNPLENITLPSTLKVLVMGSFAPKNLKKPPIKTITIGEGVLTDGEAKDVGLSVLTSTTMFLLMGPWALLGSIVAGGPGGTDGQTYLPGDFMTHYNVLFERKAGVYEYKDNDWKVKQ